MGFIRPAPTCMSIWCTDILSLYGVLPVYISTTVAATLLWITKVTVYNHNYSCQRERDGRRKWKEGGREGGGQGREGKGMIIFSSYHISDSGQDFSCLSTSGADQGIVPYMLEVFDVQSKCSWMKYKVQLGKGHHNYRWAHKHCECTSMHSSSLIHIIRVSSNREGRKLPPKTPSFPPQKDRERKRKGERGGWSEYVVGAMIYLINLRIVEYHRLKAITPQCH